MASRRSRLKAVANLPIRRKPLSVQQETENPKVQDEFNTDTVVESGRQEQEKSCEESNISEKLECHESVEPTASSGHPASTENEAVAAVLQESENISNVEVPLESQTSKPSFNNKSLSVPVSRFGRRVKPSVSLSALKDRAQKVENQLDLSTNDNEQLPASESQITEQETNSVNLSCSDVNKCVSSVKVSDQEVTLVSTLRATDNVNEEHLDSVNKNASSGNVTVDKAENEHMVHHVNEIFVQHENRTENVLQENLKTSVNNNSNQNNLKDIKINHDIIYKQKNDLVQSDKNLFENYQNHVASQNSIQLQNSPTGVKRPSSTLKQKKPKFNDFARKVADARREFQRKYEKIPPDRSSLRMIDLIFYNPSTNPMESKSKFEKRDLQLSDQELLNEGKVDDPDSVEKSSDYNGDDDLRNDEFGKMPVPQVKIGSNGEIILDEKSLVIETTEARKGREDLQNSVPVFEDRGSKTCYYKRKSQKSRDWSDLETKRFYKALNTIGTDFSLMQKYFPVRTRLELKNKFKREEKLNRSLVDKALNNPSEFDITQFEKYLAMEKQVQEEEAERRLQHKIRTKKPEKKLRMKSSFLAKEIMETDDSVVEVQNSSREEQERMKLSDKSKKANEISLLCEKYSLKASERDQDANAQQSSSVIVCEGDSQSSSFDSTSKVFTSLSISESNSVNKIRDAFDEIQNIGHSDKDIQRTVICNDNVEQVNGSAIECSILPGDTGNNVDVVDEFYQAVVSLSASLKSDGSKTNRVGKKKKRAKPCVPKYEKRKGSVQPGRKQNSKKVREDSYMSTLDIETYDSKCDSNSSSNESNDNSFTSTKTITDQDFMKLLAANAKNMKESKIQFQITEDCSLEKNVEIILDNVPSITLSEI